MRQMAMFREGSDWDSGACGFRPATERADLPTREEKALKRTSTHLQKYLGHSQLLCLEALSAAVL